MPRVLIVDDNAMNLDLASYLLEGDGWTVVTATDAAKAWERLLEARPDVILMDIQLPGQDGLSAVRQLKDDPLRRDIPVLAFTAYAMKGDEAKMLDAGCEGYISKPIDVETFCTRVRAALAGPPRAAPPPEGVAAA
jgi:two-component system, cell cycle response regulator DivK